MAYQQEDRSRKILQRARAVAFLLVCMERYRCDRRYPFLHSQGLIDMNFRNLPYFHRIPLKAMRN